MAQTIKLKRSATAGAAPTTSQLELGEVAINTYDGKMYIKKSVGGTESIVEIGSGLTPADAIFEEYLYTATSNQTAFSGNDDNSTFLSYVSGAIQVFLNGVLLDPETDYTATNGATVTLTSGAATGDYLQIIAFKKKIGDSSITIDTFSGNNSTTAFTLSLDPGDENNTRVFIDGVYQSKSNYTVSGTTLTFSSAPPSGTGIEVEIGNRAVSLDTTSSLDLPDNVKLRLGTSQDLEIYHDASDSLINDNGTGSLKLQTGGSTKLEVTSSGVDVTGNVAVSGTVDGVDIAARDAVLTSTTTTAGAALPRTGGAMTGAITTNSTFDGRDVATDGAKLDGIEAGATADQTQSEINALGITATGLSGTPAISVANITTTGELRGPASFVVDPAAVGDNTGTVIIKGNLQVDGATTTINSTTLTVDDLNITLASGAANGTAANGAGITVDGASATITYNSTGDSWDFNKDINVGNMSISGQEIDVSSGNLTLDVVGDIILDADGGDVILKDGGTEFMAFYNGTIGRTGDLLLDASGTIKLDSDNTGTVYFQDGGTIYGIIERTSSSMRIRSGEQDGDIIFMGNDNGTNITALTLDMSAAGAATFNGQANFNDSISSDGPITINGSGSEDRYLKFALDGRGSAFTGENAAFIFCGQGGSGDFLAGGLYLQSRSATAGREIGFITGTTPAKRMVIDSSGNVGIDPSSGYTLTDKLTVRGSQSQLRIQDSSVDAKGVSLLYSNSNNYGQLICDHRGNNQLNFYYSALNHYFGRNTSSSYIYMTLTDTGKLGLGTTSPFAKSHIIDTGWSSGAPYGTVQLIEGNNVNDNNWGHLVITDTTTSAGNGGAISFATGASNALNPFAGIKGVSEGTSYGGIGLFTRANGGTATERMRIDSSGHVGIKTTPSAWGTDYAVLDLNTGGSIYGTTSGVSTASNLYFTGSAWLAKTTGLGTLYAQHTGKHLWYSSASATAGGSAALSQKMELSASGNLGIGVSSPDSYPAGATTGSLSLPLEEIGMRLIFKAASGNGHAGISTIDQSGAGLMIGANTYVNSGGSVVYGRSDHPSSGIYFDGWNGNRMRFYTGASGNPTERMSILANGNVGIGTTAPTAPLSIRKVHATGYGSGIDMLDFKAYYPPNYDTETSKATIFVGTSDKHTLNTHGGYLAFRVNQSGYTGTSGATNLAEAMRIEKDGNVGIGTGSPSSKLHVYHSTNASDTLLMVDNRQTSQSGVDYNKYGIQGIARGSDASWSRGVGISGMADAATFHKAIGVYAGLTTSPASGFGYDTALFADGNNLGYAGTFMNGNVGIGTTSPSTKLHVQGADATIRISGDNSMAFHQDSAWNSNMYFGAHYDGSNVVYGATGRGAFKISSYHDGDVSPQYIAFYGANSGTSGNTITWNSVGFAQDEDGNVGIGTTSPAAPLHVYNSGGGDATNKAGMLSEAVMKLQPHATNSTNMLFAQVDGGNSMGIQVTNGPATANWDIALNPFGGNVGIGTTSPIAPLHVSGNAVIETGSPDLYLATSSASHTNWRIAAQELVNQGFEIASGTTSAGSNAVNDTYTNRFQITNDGQVDVLTNDFNNVGINDKGREISATQGKYRSSINIGYPSRTNLYTYDRYYESWNTSTQTINVFETSHDTVNWGHKYIKITVRQTSYNGGGYAEFYLNHQYNTNTLQIMHGGNKYGNNSSMTAQMTALTTVTGNVKKSTFQLVMGYYQQAYVTVESTMTTSTSITAANQIKFF